MTATTERTINTGLASSNCHWHDTAPLGRHSADPEMTDDYVVGNLWSLTG